MEAFNESGAIEYSSDVLIGLQHMGAGKQQGEEKRKEAAAASMREDVRGVELVILKNRNGRTGGKIECRYYSWFNLFEEM